MWSGYEQLPQFHRPKGKGEERNYRFMHKNDVKVKSLESWSSLGLPAWSEFGHFWVRIIMASLITLSHSVCSFSPLGEQGTEELC